MLSFHVLYTIPGKKETASIRKIYTGECIPQGTIYQYKNVHWSYTKHSLPRYRILMFFTTILLISKHTLYYDNDMSLAHQRSTCRWTFFKGNIKLNLSEQQMWICLKGKLTNEMDIGERYSRLPLIPDFKGTSKIPTPLLVVHFPGLCVT